MPAPSFSCSPNLRPRPRDLVALLTVLTATALAGPARAQTSVTCETQMVPMRDGTKLYTELYRPAAPGRYPVALVRDSKHVELGREFINAISSESGQRILQGKGFMRAGK